MLCFIHSFNLLNMGNTTFKNIVLVGATGNLGKHILPALLADATFQVTVLSRNQSSATFPSNVKVIKADYSKHAELVKALQGQEVVISTVGGEGLATNFDSTLIKAAIEAGVKWFIPSEFGVDTGHPAVANHPVLAVKTAVAKLLKENESRMAHTFIVTGCFLDWGFDNGFLGFDLTKKTATLYDEGKHPISGTTLPHIGQAVVAILHHFSSTKNKRIFIADTTFTQQQALALFEKHTNSQWTTKQMTTESLVKTGADAFAKGDVTTGIVSNLLNIIYSGTGASDFEKKTSNRSLGIKTSSLEEIIKDTLEKRGMLSKTFL